MAIKRRNGHSVNILVVLPRLPVPAWSGTTLRTLHLLQGLAREASIDVLSIAHRETSREDMAQLTQCCRRLDLVRWQALPLWRQVPGVLRRFAAGMPFNTKYFDNRELRRKLYERTRAGSYDVVIIQQIFMAGYLRSVDRAHAGKVVLETHDMNTELYKRRFLLERNPFEKLKVFLTWMPLRTWEIRMAGRFDLVVTVSEKDKTRFLSRKKGLNIAVIPNGVDTETNRPAPRLGRDEEILYVGSMDYAPNVDAALYMCKEIFPRIRRRRPHCTLSIVGKEPPREIRRLGLSPGVTVAGDVSDVRPYYRRAGVAVIPLRFGGGSRLKILESMALGTPVVSTGIGCEGLDVENGRHLLVADRPDDFAACVDRLFTDVDLWEGLARAGRCLVVQSYDWRGIAALYLKKLERLTKPASSDEITRIR